MHTLGSGAFAIVKLAQHLPSGRRVALKLYHNHNIESGIKLKVIDQEIHCMKALSQSDGFPKLYADFKTETDDIVLVQEYISGKSLLKVVQNK
jgi:serine/threonine protein kinase